MGPILSIIGSGLEGLHVKYLLSIFTADRLSHAVQMAGVETIWELHTLIEILLTMQ